MEEFMDEFDKMLELLDISWFLRDQIVPCLVGPPGIGKTAAVVQHSKTHGSGRIVKIVASRCVPSETVGMTMPDHDNKSMVIYNSMQLSSLKDGDILFFDELLEADQFVLSTLLTLIESREMADGTKLPDIQIVAATNDTISPEQLKGNIRQRFMFQRFKLSREQTRTYIHDKVGMNIPSEIIKKLCDNGNDYNFLTPRSLTKLCLLVDAVPADRLDETSRVINQMWGSLMGTHLVQERLKRDYLREHKDPDEQVRATVRKLIDDKVIDDPSLTQENFDDCTIPELLKILQGLPIWGDVEKILASTQLEEVEDNANVDVSF